MIIMTKRAFYCVAAALFFIWENFAAMQWVRRFDSIGAALSHTWQTMTEDWMTLLILQDAAVLAILVISWLLLDTRSRGLSGRQRFTWLILTLIVGSPIILIYLGYRPSQRMEPLQNAT